MSEQFIKEIQKLKSSLKVQRPQSTQIYQSYNISPKLSFEQNNHLSESFLKQSQSTSQQSYLSKQHLYINAYQRQQLILSRTEEAETQRQSDNQKLTLMRSQQIELFSKRHNSFRQYVPGQKHPKPVKKPPIEKDNFEIDSSFYAKVDRIAQRSQKGFRQ